MLSGKSASRGNALFQAPGKLLEAILGEFFKALFPEKPLEPERKLRKFRRDRTGNRHRWVGRVDQGERVSPR